MLDGFLLSFRCPAVARISVPVDNDRLLKVSRCEVGTRVFGSLLRVTARSDWQRFDAIATNHIFKSFALHGC